MISLDFPRPILREMTHVSPWLKTKGWDPSSGQRFLSLNCVVSQTIYGGDILDLFSSNIGVSICSIGLTSSINCGILTGCVDGQVPTSLSKEEGPVVG